MTDTPTNAPVSELLPCPFCGSKKIWTDCMGPNEYGVECYCNAGVILCGPEAQTREAAIAAWNTRLSAAAEPPSVNEVEAVARALCRLDANKDGIWFDDAALNQHIVNHWRSFKNQASTAIAAMSARSPVGWEDEAKSLAKLIVEGGHVRLCQGREYTCTCGFDEQVEGQAADLLQKMAGKQIINLA